ncbi:MAG: DUF58 domain-containing protein [Bacteroidales bacterium]|nr:DUF58 domain-containing protein [Bacteroidales bacterium]
MMKIKTPFWVILGILGIAIIGLLWTRSVIYNRLIYFCVLMILISWLWTSLSIVGISIKRYARGFRQEVGEVFEEKYEVNNELKIFRLWLEIKDLSMMQSSGSSRVISSLGPKSMRTYSSYTLLYYRGEYELSPTKILSGDPFGLFSTYKIVESKQNLLVLPYLLELNTFPVASGQLAGGVAVKRKTPQIEPPNVVSVREHAHGDPLSRIHWPSTAKRDMLMVKEFEQDPQVQVWIILDAYKNAHQEPFHTDEKQLNQIPLWWLKKSVFELPKSTIEYGVTIAGSVAKYYLREGQTVGLITSGKKQIVMSPEKGERQLNKILEALALTSADGKLPLHGLLELQTKQIAKGSTVVVISPANVDTIKKSISVLFKRGIKPIYIVFEPGSFGGFAQEEEINASFRDWSVPYSLIKYGDDISEKLEKGFIGVSYLPLTSRWKTIHKN